MRGTQVRLEWLIPVAIAAAYVFVKFEAIPTPLAGLVRPLTIAVLVAIALQTIATLITRSSVHGSVLAGAAVLSIARMWPLGLILVAVAGAGFLLERRHDPGVTSSPAVRIVAGMPRGIGVIALILAIVSMVPVASKTVAIPNTVGARAIEIPEGTSRPDIFVIILDGYPSTALLAETFGYDNAQFDRNLGSLGFEVSPASRSNYTSTWASLASFLNMRYLDELPWLDEIPAEPAPQHRALMTAIAHSAGVTALRDAGYRIVTVPSPFESTSLSNADVIHRTGSPTAFEHSLIQDTVAAGFLEMVAPRLLTELHRAGIQDALALTVEVAQTPEVKPVFSLTHLMSPHAPYAFTANGALVEPLACYPASCTFWGGEWQDLPGQVHYLNRLVLETLRATVEARPDAVVVLMSDHGSQPGNRAPEGNFQNLVAIRAPGIEGLAPPDISLVNLLATVLNGTLNADLPLRPHRAWMSQADEPLTTTPFDP